MKCDCKLFKAADAIRYVGITKIYHEKIILFLLSFSKTKNITTVLLGDWKYILNQKKLYY